MKKSDRHRMLLSMIEEFEITRQEQFIEILNSRGIYVAQATISRDITELDLIKLPGSTGVKKYARNEQATTQSKESMNLPRHFQQILQLDQMVLIETYPGSAFLLKQQLKRHYPQNIMLSDDDTVVIYFTSSAEAKGEKERIEGGI